MSNADEKHPGGLLATTPCQMLLSGSPRAPDERTCGVTPTVGGNRLYRYCAHHLEMVERAGGAVYRDADADLKIDANGDIVPITLTALEMLRRAGEPPRPFAVGDYIRIDWTVPDGGNGHSCYENLAMPVWVEGEVMCIHRPKLDLLADVRVDRSNWLVIGSVHGIGIEHGAKRIPRPGGAAVTLPTAGTVSGTIASGAPTGRKTIRCEQVWPGPDFVAGGSYVVGEVVRASTGAFECAASGAASNASSPVGMLAGGWATIRISPLNATLKEFIVLSWREIDADPTQPRVRGAVVGDQSLAHAKCWMTAALSWPELALNEMPMIVVGIASLPDGKTEIRLVEDVAARLGRVEGAPFAKAPPPEALPALEARLAALRLEPPGPIIFDADPAPPLRLDGFQQAQVDAAKAVLLAPVAKRGGR